MSSICTFMDLFPSITLDWKTQGSKSYFTVKEWTDAVSLSLFNLFFSSWLVVLPTFALHKLLVRKGFHESLASFNDDFDLVSEVGRFAACGIIIDVWFYATHKMLHWPRFYKAIHKLHHRFKAPTAVASMYAHPVEFTIGNVLGVILGPAITNCHPFTACFWYAFSLISTGGSHSGYLFFLPKGTMRITSFSTTISVSAFSWISCVERATLDRHFGRKMRAKSYLKEIRS